MSTRTTILAAVLLFAGQALLPPAAGAQKLVPMERHTKSKTRERSYPDDYTFPVFQVGADALGGFDMGGTEFIAGVNFTLMWPLHSMVWVGIRPSLHYSYQTDSVYEATWIHPDVAVQLNLLHQPVRLYGLVSGGYMGALDGDLHRGLADGWSVLAGMGAAWMFSDSLGVFMELGFRTGSANQADTIVERDEGGNPICADPECQEFLKADVTKTLSLYAFTINLGLTYVP
ncbi:MAG: hypothetical protein D6806_09260 [Deltaproteobacteria bacterium]|nr:MAG: hypothetical protein D6806_09260 [Deltaproteobacteria bacterium]